MALDFTYKSIRPLREWRVTLRWSDGTSIRMFAEVEHFSDYPPIEVLDAAIEAHGLSDQYLIGATLDRYSTGYKVR